IIQVPLRLPNATKKQLSNYTFSLLNDTLSVSGITNSVEILKTFEDEFSRSFLPFMDNPRMAIRYSNALFFTIPLLKGEVNIQDLMTIEGLKVFYPETHS